MNSVWVDHCNLPHFESLDGSIKTDALKKIGYGAVMVQNTGLPVETVGAIGFEDQGQFHPLKFMAGLARGLNIYEHTFVKEFKDHTAVTDHGNIVFQKVIFATHFPIDNKHGMYFLKLYQAAALAAWYDMLMSKPTYHVGEVVKQTKREPL